MSKEIEAIAYLRPHGRKVRTMISDVYPDDADYIISNNIPISLESDGMAWIMYFRYGFDEEHAEPLEYIEIGSLLTPMRDIIRKAVEALKKIELEIKSENHE